MVSIIGLIVALCLGKVYLASSVLSSGPEMPCFASVYSVLLLKLLAAVCVTPGESSHLPRWPGVTRKGRIATQLGQTLAAERDCGGRWSSSWAS